MHTFDYNRIAVDMFCCQNCFENAKAKFRTILSWTFVKRSMYLRQEC
jgi:hypothetical protein